ncbi:DUF3105 domain-containing protein [Solirubrobacter soli]|uniref:DUF3105 domain-containing protein n=1 Tax=Solirubrobacter soli TaxID=363832 RepID=UPI0012F95780|nr:DUF3105 domain-containing protein [Solirubrobacter soli]
MRRVLIVVAAVVVAAVGCVALIALLTSQDSSQVNEASGPGTLEPDRGSGLQSGPVTPASPADRPPTSGRHREEHVLKDQTELTDDQILDALQNGNVIVTYDQAKPPKALVALQRDVQGGPFDAFLSGAGQAVILAHRPGAGTQALAWRRRLIASGPDDPKLREFADAWLGQGPSG